jgi:hypothetical protein
MLKGENCSMQRGVRAARQSLQAAHTLPSFKSSRHNDPKAFARLISDATKRLASTQSFETLDNVSAILGGGHGKNRVD